ncbi:hypothetical protein JOC48_001647 [Aquibacillus albus]|uniref:Uncharacterized protein n=1 Tax=Aquibacillus albus TaxID=1168171 RepID=A0ABS2MZ44_9BACI|nr:hypothetical protein [Aquibacillus albus]
MNRVLSREAEGTGLMKASATSDVDQKGATSSKNRVIFLGDKNG